ncbi:MAG: DNA-binding protein [Lachnospiraceae bacterium]|nr:DNA-binding protein [Lachnospiraceae bacterium]
MPIDNNRDIILYDINDIKEIFGVGTNKAYQILKISGFPTITIGSKRLVEKSSLVKWLDMNKGKDIIL